MGHQAAEITLWRCDKSSWNIKADMWRLQEQQQQLFTFLCWNDKSDYHHLARFLLHEEDSGHDAD